MVFTPKEWNEVEAICKNREQQYERFLIPKKSGGKREILAPNDRLKELQKKLMNEFLYVRYIPSVYATGFIVDRSIVHNAMAHVGAKVLVNVDVKDFFPTITYEMLEEKIFLKKLVRLKELEKMLAEKNLKGPVKTMIGGGATSKEFAAQIGADAWGYDAIEAVKIVANLLKK